MWFRCLCCRRYNARMVNIRFRGQVMFRAPQCRDCQARAEVELSLLRGEFLQLRDRGVDRRMALRYFERRLDELYRNGVLTAGAMSGAP